MHLVLLGVTRKMLSISSKGRAGLQEKKVEVNKRLEYARDNMLPNYSFSRKPSSLDMLVKWKATEFHQFLLYTGPLILEDILDKTQYNHFPVLHIAIRIVLHPILSKNHDHLENAKKLIDYFVNEFEFLYGENSVTMCII